MLFSFFGLFHLLLKKALVLFFEGLLGVVVVNGAHLTQLRIEAKLRLHLIFFEGLEEGEDGLLFLEDHEVEWEVDDDAEDDEDDGENESKSKKEEWVTQ